MDRNTATTVYLPALLPSFWRDFIVHEAYVPINSYCQQGSVMSSGESSCAVFSTDGHEGLAVEGPADRHPLTFARAPELAVVPADVRRLSLQQVQFQSESRPGQE